MKNRIIAAFLSFSFLSFLLPYSLAEENKKSKDADELLEAIEQHKVQQVRDLLKNNSTLANTRFEDSEGYGLVTPLFYAIKVKDAEICKLLIQAGTDVNFVTVVFGAPLHYAIFNPNFPLGALSVLLGCQAVHLRSFLPLFVACSNGYRLRSRAKIASQLPSLPSQALTENLGLQEKKK